MLAYFLGTMFNLLPLPGSLSGGLAGTLVVFGAPAAPALAAVLAYRTIAVWLPAASGVASLRAARDGRALARGAGQRLARAGGGCGYPHPRSPAPRIGPQGPAGEAPHRESTTESQRGHRCRPTSRPPARATQTQHVAGLRMLDAAIDGTIVAPGDAGYDQARQAWNLAVDQRPAAVAYPQSAADVAAIVDFARERAA